MNWQSIKWFSAAIVTLPLIAGCPSASMPTTPSTPSMPSASMPSPSSSGSSGSSGSRSSSSSSSSSSSGGSAGSSGSSGGSSGSSGGSSGSSSGGGMPSGGGVPGTSSGGGIPVPSRPGGGGQGGQPGSSGGTSGGQTASSGGGSSSSASGGDPGFGDAAGGDPSLPSLVDAEAPSDVALADNNQQGDSSGETAGDSTGESSQGSGAGSEQSNDGDSGSSSSAGTNNSSADDGVGTRAQGGLDPEWGDGPMTTAERVAVLDRRLEASTSVFDDVIRRERSQQRQARREQDSAKSSGDAGTDIVTSGQNPYETDDEIGTGTTGGAIGGHSRNIPSDPIIYEIPEDIPPSDDDDIVAEQLREAAMREVDPIVREGLWNEYRKYKGIEIPEE